MNKEDQYKRKVHEAVKNYRDTIIENYYSRHGEEKDTGILKKEIIDLFKGSKNILISRENLQYIILRNLSEPADARGGSNLLTASSVNRLNICLNKLGHELSKELENIKFEKVTWWFED